MIPARCPHPLVLEKLALGRLSGPEAGELEAHLTTCPRCIATLENLPADDDLVRALRPPLRNDELKRNDLAQAIIPALKQLRPQPTAATLDLATVKLSGSSLESSSISAEAAAARFPFLAPAQQPDEIGRLGGFRVLSVLGSGGMGVVFLADDPALKRPIALKVIKPGLLAAAEHRARFLHEAQALAALEHDHIVAIYQVGEQNGAPFLAMPLLRGETLEQRLERTGGPLPVAFVLRVGREVAAGLAAAHARGMVHRDIKPANIWIELAANSKSAEPQEDRELVGHELPAVAPERAKILDFGLVRALCGEGPAGEESRLLAGTPAYMAPEQARGEDVDGRADLFALGCVLYQTATGRVPFAPGDLVQTLARVAIDVPPLPRQINPEVPAELELLIVRLMEKRPLDRPESAQTVVEILQEIEASRQRLSRRRWLVGAGTAALAAGLATWAVSSWMREPPPAPGKITFEYDEPDARLALRLGDDAERIVDVRSENTLSLPPGDYALRALAATEKRSLWPARLLVKAGETKTVVSQLVGQARQHRTHGPLVRAVAVAQRKEGLLVLSAGDDRALVAWKPAGTDKPRILKHLESPLRCVTLSADGHLAATGSGDTGPRAVQLISFWNLDQMQRSEGGLACRSQVNVLAFTADGSKLISGEHDGTLRLWDLKTQSPIAEQARAHDAQGVFALALLPAGDHLLTGGGDGAIVERTTADLRPTRTLGEHQKAVQDLVVLPEGKQAASVGLDSTIHVWDLAPGRGDNASSSGKHRSWTAPAPLYALAVSPNGKRLLTGDEGRPGDLGGAIRLWDATTQEEIVRFEGHAGRVTAVAFTPDGQRAVSAGSDGTVRLWDLPSISK